ncbi:TetR/AcrR family transcriptional regulator [Galactobacter caseinivorans]|uniref:TetR/AcrR family transcriptional regulator n=1 Tax=Galactobacter caseinivorans TaxID=2676123 RepID=A0A496PMR7_9MICC|nr:TetR/AcrR family transcriptional regulator [Galactobacter caseinivorans]RKW71825.1 TetR/AcrR family transcriptional regulator [Galactobacter caseinivorans]
MASPPPAPGRRERNKQAKLERIVAAAAQLFSERGVADATTQQIADAADIGAGTLFLYAKSKSELLLLVQNSAYAEALSQGKAAALAETVPLDAVMAIVRPVVECNRVQVENGRTYLREMVFGDATEPHHREALTLSAQTEEAIADALGRTADVRGERASALAHIVSAVMLLAMSAPANTRLSAPELVLDLRQQLGVLLAR